MQSGGLLPALPGSLQPATRGVAYFYRDSAGRQHKKYIRQADREQAQAEIAAYRLAHPPAWSLRQALAALRRERGNA